MNTTYLLSHKYKTPGWVMLILGLVSGVFVLASGYESHFLETNVFAIWSDSISFSNSTEDSGQFFRIIENSIVDELSALLIIVGGLLVGFSKEKIEDEFIYKLRKDSLVWAIIFNYIVLSIAIIFVYELSFFNILVYNMFTPLLFFIIRFNILKARA